MSKQIDNVPWHSLPGLKPQKPANAKYPWDRWFNGKTHLLIAGEDFTRDLTEFRTYLYEMSMNRGVIVKTAVTRDGNLYVRKTGSRRHKRVKDPTIEAVLRGEPVASPEPDGE